MDRYQKLEVCLPHAGGSFPYLFGRFNHGAQVRAEMDHMEKDVIEYLRRFHYDTVSHSSAFDCLVRNRSAKLCNRIQTDGFTFNVKVEGLSLVNHIQRLSRPRHDFVTDSVTLKHQ